MSFRSIFAPAKVHIFGIDLFSVFLLSLFMTNTVGNMNYSETPSDSTASIQGETRTLELPSDIKPVSVTIPAIGLTTNIELLGLGSDGLQQVPNKYSSVSLYQLGPLPGQVGNAVLAGHYKLEDGSIGPFFELNKAKVGDTIVIKDTAGLQKEFKIYKTEVVDVEKFSVEKVYGSSTSSSLNLVTCQGDFNPVTNDYTKRLIVYSFLTQ